jgi:hypothetical protein
MNFKTYHKLVRLLRERCPAAYPVSVRRVKMRGKDGECSKGEQAFHIKINKELMENAAIDALLHEWAHARAWNHLHDVVDCEEFEKRMHDASWGVAYAEVYRIFHENF